MSLLKLSQGLREHNGKHDPQRCNEKLELEKKIIGAGNFNNQSKDENKPQKTTQLDFIKATIRDSRAEEKVFVILSMRWIRKSIKGEQRKPIEI